METLAVNRTKEEERITKPNLSVLILLLFLALLSVGCASREGLFFQLDGGIAAVRSNHEWTRWSTSGKLIEREKITVIEPAPLVGVKLGLGITDRVIISLPIQYIKLESNALLLSGIGGTFFHKKNVPSFFVETDFLSPVNIPLGDDTGTWGSFAIGYEFKKHLAIRVNFCVGNPEYYVPHRFSPLDSGWDYRVEDDAKANVSLGITISLLGY